MKYRFKTKQELEKINFIKWNYLGAMDYLFGLPVKEEWIGKRIELYPNLTKGQDIWRVWADIIPPTHTHTKERTFR